MIGGGHEGVPSVYDHAARSLSSGAQLPILRTVILAAKARAKPHDV